MGQHPRRAAAHSHVYINAFGDLAISLPLLVLWLVVVLFFDSKMYMVFAPGQLLVRQDIGSGEVAYDTMGMVVAKRLTDLFRHWLLGFGSGDLIVKICCGRRSAVRDAKRTFCREQVEIDPGHAPDRARW